MTGSHGDPGNEEPAGSAGELGKAPSTDSLRPAAGSEPGSPDCERHVRPLDLFVCPRHPGALSLTPRACADSWRAHRAHRHHGCCGCPIGAGHAGAPVAPAPRPRCCYCLRPYGRIQFGLLCISCYNRLRERAVGRNRRGNPPLRPRLLVYEVPLAPPAGPRPRVGFIVTIRRCEHCERGERRSTSHVASAVCATRLVAPSLASAQRLAQALGAPPDAPCREIGPADRQAVRAFLESLRSRPRRARGTLAGHSWATFGRNQPNSATRPCR
jgi:hypothetical protein